MTLSTIQVGIVGTGYVAQRRAEAIQADRRSHLRYICGHTPEKTSAFSEKYHVPSLASWPELVSHPDLDLIIITTINRDHAPIARTALEAGKNVIVEYPLALSWQEGAQLLTLAAKQGKLLHVEHIELLGGLHQSLKQNLPALGTPFYARYSTITPQRPAPQRWVYHRQMFGFPLIAALSRVHRLTNLFGTVSSVSCCNRFWDSSDPEYFTACLTNAQLQFSNGVIAELVYGKGEAFWHADRSFVIYGDQGTLFFPGDEGKLITPGETITLEGGIRRGLLAQDTHCVLDHLCHQIPLYVTPQESLYALKVAETAAQAAQLGQMLSMDGRNDG